MSIYEFNKKEVLESTGMSKRDVEKWLPDGESTIYSVSDYIEMLDGSGILEDELNGRSKEEYIKDLESGSIHGDIDSGIYNGCSFVIQYRL